MYVKEQYLKFVLNDHQIHVPSLAGPEVITFLYPPQTVFVGGYTVFTLSVHPSVRSSVTFCFLNIFKSP